MYALAEITGGGYIYAWDVPQGRIMMHKETRLRREFLSLRTLVEAKAALEDAEFPGAQESSPRMILGFDEEGGVKSIWCYADLQEDIRARLKTWNGCYGAWKVRTLKREAVCSI